MKKSGRRTFRIAAVCSVVAAFSVVSGGAGLSVGAPARTLPTPAPTPQTPYTTMLGVSASSPHDAWTVGYSDDRHGLPTAVVEHWDGGAWSAVDSHAPGPNSTLRDVTALSASDAWAVGAHLKTGVTMSVPLAEHWNGTRWSSVATPKLDVTYADLASISAISSDDVWAVGGTVKGSIYLPLVEHWDGTSWRLIAAPSGPSGLVGVSAISDDDVWAVGDGFVEHWDGTTWSSSSPGGTADAVSAVSANDVWVVGSDNTRTTFAAHWDGTAWSRLTTPNGRGPRNGLVSVDALATDDVWAVGFMRFGGRGHALTEHWDGSSWSLVRSPSPLDDSTLADVDGDAQSDVWAVGISTSGPLAEHWGGSRWRLSPLA